MSRPLLVASLLLDQVLVCLPEGAQAAAGRGGEVVVWVGDWVRRLSPARFLGKPGVRATDPAAGVSVFWWDESHLARELARLAELELGRK